MENKIDQVSIHNAQEKNSQRRYSLTIILNNESQVFLSANPNSSEREGKRCVTMYDLSYPDIGKFSDEIYRLWARMDKENQYPSPEKEYETLYILDFKLTIAQSLRKDFLKDLERLARRYVGENYDFNFDTQEAPLP